MYRITTLLRSERESQITTPTIQVVTYSFLARKNVTTRITVFETQNFFFKDMKSIPREKVLRYTINRGTA